MSRLIDWKSVCLICLKQGENRSIFEQDDDSNVIADKVMKCSNITIEKGTDKLKIICLECLDDLNVTYKFRRNYEQSRSIIKSFLNTNHKQFELKDFRNKLPITMNPTHDIGIKDETTEMIAIGDSYDDKRTPCFDLKDIPDTETKFVVEDRVQSSATELHNVKANESNRIKQEAKEEISTGSAEVSSPKRSVKSTYKRPLKICEICNRNCWGQRDFKIHMMRHNNERPFNCDHCDKSFATLGGLYRHVRGYSGLRPHKCQYCDRAFLDIHVKRNHERTHTDERPYVCQTCGKSFRYSYALARHLPVHDVEKKFVCKECGKGFTRRTQLETHAARHLARDELDKSSELKQKKIVEREIFQVEECANSNEINIKHEIVDNSVIDDPGTEAKFAVENRVEDCVQNETDYGSKKTKLEANNDISTRFSGQSKTSTEQSSDKPAPKSTYKAPLKICNICDRSFKGQQVLKIHMRRHNNERPFSCDHCDKAFVSAAELRRHVRVYTGQKPYKCQYCDRAFVDAHARTNHERTHTGERPYVCSTCGKGFTYSTSLSDHLRVHTGEKKFVCTECGKGFARKVLLERHAVRHLVRDKLSESSELKPKERHEKEIFKIEECANSNEINIKHEIIDIAVADDYGGDNSHCLDLGHDPGTNVKANESNKIAQGANGELPRRLRGQPNTSVEGKPSPLSAYKKPLKFCKICNRSYRGQREFTIHMRRHNNERPFSCDHCDKTFVTATDLRRHVRVYTGQRPYKCRYCDRGFVDTQIRKNHERIHTGEKPFACPTCGKSFTVSASLKEHLRVHTGEKKYVCKECGKGFTRKAKFEAHAAVHLSQDKLAKTSENKQQEKEIFQIEENQNSNEINIKHEIIDKGVVEESCVDDNSPCLNLGEDTDTTAKLVVENYTDTSDQKNAKEINQEANNESSICLSGQSTGSAEVSGVKSSLKSAYKRPLKFCKICNRSYRGQQEFTLHMRRHNNERPFNCDHCDKAFVSAAELRRHVRVYTGQRPYKCQYCDRGFVDSQIRKNHERTHTDERPYVCLTCGKSFRYSYALSQHHSVHSAVKKFVCQKCGKRYTRKSVLDAHLALHLSQDEFDKLSEHKEKKQLRKKNFKIDENKDSNEINIKQEIIDNTVPDDSCGDNNSPCLDLGDEPDAEAKMDVENHADTCDQSNAEKTNQDANNEGSICLSAQSTGSAEVSGAKPNLKKAYKRPLKFCKICNRSYIGQQEFTLHMRRHNNERPFSCDHCDKAFVSAAELLRHVKVYTGQRPYKCQYCDRGFVDAQVKKNHERTHTDERPYVCLTCGKSFRYSHTLQQHHSVHSAVKKFVCQKCGKGYTRKSVLKAHLALHLTQDECDKLSERKQNFQIEENKDSNEINIKPEIINNTVADDSCGDNSPCLDLGDDPDTKSKLVVENHADTCNQGIATELNNVKAIESKKAQHGEDNKSSIRLRGQSKTSTQVSSDKPISKSTDKAPLNICKVCNRSFKGQQVFKIHMRRHNNERPFSCDHCDKAFVRAAELRRHVRVYTGQKPYKCQYCDRAFVDAHARTNHERTHTGERPYVCLTCGKGFSYSTSLSDHLRTHTGEKKYVCTKCGKGFNKKMLYTSHIPCQPTQGEVDKLMPKQEKMLEKEIFQVEECVNSNEINIKHEVKLIEEEIN